MDEIYTTSYVEQDINYYDGVGDAPGGGNLYGWWGKLASGCGHVDEIQPDVYAGVGDCRGTG